MCRRRVIQLRRKHRRGADHIAHTLGIAAFTAQAILIAAGLGRLDRGDRATGSSRLRPQRYEREQPGELVHVDVRNLAAIPPGGGWRMHGKTGRPRRIFGGYRYIHTALDDRSRLTRFGDSPAHRRA